MKGKKLLAAVLAMVMILCMIPLAVSASDSVHVTFSKDHYYGYIDPVTYYMERDHEPVDHGVLTSVTRGDSSGTWHIDSDDHDYTLSSSNKNIVKYSDSVFKAPGNEAMGYTVWEGFVPVSAGTTDIVVTSEDGFKSTAKFTSMEPVDLKPGVVYDTSDYQADENGCYFFKYNGSEEVDYYWVPIEGQDFDVWDDSDGEYSIKGTYHNYLYFETNDVDEETGYFACYSTYDESVQKIHLYKGLTFYTAYGFGEEYKPTKEEPYKFMFLSEADYQLYQKHPSCILSGHKYKNGYCTECGALEPGSEGAKNRVLKQNQILRVYGNTRYGTSLNIADQLKAALGVSKFDSVIIANSNNFPDALSGSYLATVKNAPVLIVNSINGGDTSQNLVLDYVKNNLKSGGTIYVLGGNSAVSSAYEKQLASYGTVKRLSGDTRFDTNLAILKAAGVKGDEILVADASASFADALSASSTGKPLLLVNKGQADKNGNFTGTLTTAQLNYLKSTGIKKVTILGGTQAVPTTIEKQIKDLGITVTRLAGSTRYETSAKIAAKYFSKTNAVTIAWGGNFPDALCGGPLANAIGASVVLTDSSNTYAKAYVSNFSDFKVVAFGGAGGNNNQLTDAAINNVKKGTIATSLNKN